MIFGNGLQSQGFIIAEKKVLFEINKFNIAEGLISLLSSYYAFYINYPKSSPATGVLLFIQEILLCIPDTTVKKTSTYSSLVDHLTAN